MAVAYVNSFGQGFGTATSVSLSQLPTGWAAGDLCFLLIADATAAASQSISTITSGWTQLFAAAQDPSRDVIAWLYYRELQAGDSAPSWTYSIAGDDTSAVAYLMRGHKSPAAFSGSSSVGGSAVTSIATSTIAAVLHDTVVSFVATDATTGSARPFYTQSGSGVTKDVDYEGTNNNEMGIASQSDVAAGNYSHTWGLPVSENPVTFIVSVQASTVTASGTGIGAGTVGAGTVGVRGTATDTTAPIANISTGPDVTKISRVVGKDASTFSFTPNEAIQAYQIRLVPGAASPVTAGTLIESGTSVASGVAQSITVTDDELVAAGGVAGANIVKVFVQDLAGNWST